MISECVTKSSITADTAFRKILSLQGCTTLPTRANRLLMPDHQSSSFGGRQRVDGYTLFMRKSIHDPSGECYQRSAQGMNPIAATYSIYNTNHFREPFQQIILLTPKWKQSNQRSHGQMCTRQQYCKDYPFSPTRGLYAQSWLKVENNSPRVGETELITTYQVAFHTRLTLFPSHVLIVIISCTNTSPIIPGSIIYLRG